MTRENERTGSCISEDDFDRRAGHPSLANGVLARVLALRSSTVAGREGIGDRVQHALALAAAAQPIGCGVQY